VTPEEVQFVLDSRQTTVALRDLVEWFKCKEHEILERVTKVADEHRYQSERLERLLAQEKAKAAK
jgi:hypothetical protein